MATLTWLLPASGELFAPDASVVMRVRASRGDGGDWLGPTVPLSTNFSAVSALSRSGAFYEATASVGTGQPALSATAGWDGGPVATINFGMDGVGPVLAVTVVSVASYGDGGTDFLPQDPSSPGAFRKDEVIAVDVVSADSDVLGASVQLVASFDGGPGFSAPAGVACDGGTGSCQRFQVDLSRVLMNDFRGSVTLSASGRDVRNNVGTPSKGSALVTRWQWARRLGQAGVTGSLKATPAIGDGGLIFVGIANGTDAGLVAVNPNGTVAWLLPDGPVTGSPAIGSDNNGVQYAFYQPVVASTPTLKAARANGTVATQTCAAANTGTAEGSLTVMGEGTSDVAGVGVQPAVTGSRVAVLKPAQASCPADATGLLSAVPFPGGVVTNGTTGYFVGSNGAMRNFTVSGAVIQGPLNHQPASVGTVNGLAVVTGQQVAGGGGGGPGIGRFFSIDVTSTGATTWATASSSPTSAPIIVDGGMVGAVRTSVDQLELVLLDQYDGGVTARSKVMPGSEFTGNQVPTPAAGHGSRLYAADEKGRLYVLRQNEVNDAGSDWPTVALPAAVAGAVSASLALDCNRLNPASQTGVLYIATETGWLVSYLVDSKGLDPTAPWPKYQRDARNTGSFTGPPIACP